MKKKVIPNNEVEQLADLAHQITQCQGHINAKKQELYHQDNLEVAYGEQHKELERELQKLPLHIASAREEAALSFGTPSEPTMVAQLQRFEAEQARFQSELDALVEKHNQEADQQKAKRETLASDLEVLHESLTRLTNEHSRLKAAYEQRLHDEAEALYSFHNKQVESLTATLQEMKRMATAQSADLAMAIEQARYELTGEQLRRFSTKYPITTPLERLQRAYEAYLNVLIVEGPHVREANGLDTLLAQIVTFDEMLDCAAGSQHLQLQQKKRRLVA